MGRNGYSELESIIFLNMVKSILIKVNISFISIKAKTVNMNTAGRIKNIVLMLVLKE